MPKEDDLLTRLRALCLALPDTQETLTWGHPNFRVGEKIFVGFGVGDDGPGMSVKLAPDHGDALLDDPRFTRAAYVGRFGWISMDLSPPVEWPRVEALVTESYRLIAPKKSLAKLAATGGAAKPKPKPKAIPRKKSPARKG